MKNPSKNFPRKFQQIFPGKISLPLMVLFMCLTVYDSRVRLGAFGLAMEMLERK